MKTIREDEFGIPPFWDSKEMYAMDEQRLKGIEEDIKSIKENHLISIYKSLGKLRGQVWYILGILGVLVPLALLILGILLARVW